MAKVRESVTEEAGCSSRSKNDTERSTALRWVWGLKFMDSPIVHYQERWNWKLARDNIATFRSLR